jgi:hypothetical protein
VQAFIFPALALAAGACFLFRNISYYRHEHRLIHFLETSPKAGLWVSRFGLERTLIWTKKYFLPLGCLVSLCLIVVGLKGLYTVLPQFLPQL